MYSSLRLQLTELPPQVHLCWVTASARGLGCKVSLILNSEQALLSLPWVPPGPLKPFNPQGLPPKEQQVLLDQNERQEQGGET